MNLIIQKIAIYKLKEVFLHSIQSKVFSLGESFKMTSRIIEIESREPYDEKHLAEASLVPENTAQCNLSLSAHCVTVKPGPP